MGERTLRGSRLGATSYETERNSDLAPRLAVEYECAKGHRFCVSFAEGAEVPWVWECRRHGAQSRRVEGVEPEAKRVKPPRTHWDMLRERRSIEELEGILSERLDQIRDSRSLTA